MVIIMFLLILCCAASLPLFIFGLIFRKKPLWITGVILFSVVILTLIIMMAARNLF